MKMQLTHKRRVERIAFALVPGWLFWLAEAGLAVLTFWQWQGRRTWHGRHAAYIKSRVWRMKRARMLHRADYACQVCNSFRGLELHHREYGKPFGFEDDSDLTVLCGKCHGRHHNR